MRACVPVCVCVRVQKCVPPALSLSAAYPITASRIHEGYERVSCHFLGRLMFQAEARQKPLDRVVRLESRVSRQGHCPLLELAGQPAVTGAYSSSFPLCLSISLWFRLAIRREKRFAK